MSDNSIFSNPPRGMRDFYPEDMAVRNAIFDAWTDASRRFCFEPYDACVVESLDLLKRKAGEEIDSQIYSFKDKSGRDLALRPEMTPTLARMVAARQSSLRFPLKWYTIAQCFRYERTTRGRKREHYQWNLDIIGEDSIAAETEIIAAAVHSLKTLGLDSTAFKVFFNNRRILSEILNKLDVKELRHNDIFNVLDKKGKLPPDELRQKLLDTGLADSVVARLFDIVDKAGLPDIRKLIGTDSPAVLSVDSFIRLLESYGLSDTVVFDLSIVRGLSYYTGIVFEAYDTNKEFRAIFGGGRYDNLLSDIGGKPATAAGLGFGDVVISEILDHLKINLLAGRRPSVAIGFMQEDQRTLAAQLACALRTAGSGVDLATSPEKPKSFFARAGGTPCFLRGIYIGPDDAAKGAVRVKNLAERSENEVAIKEIIRTGRLQ